VKKQQPAALRFGVLASAVSVALGGGVTPARAQNEAEKRAQTPIEEVVVTGSRIVRRDLEANSPIVTVDATRFEEQTSVAIEAAMNQLPQFVPAVSQFDAGNTFAGSQRTPGAATLSLRGLGSNRNLVLLDGRRAMPINASMAVSINTIPSAAIERIETITGGASSVYGADAVAGVVNFITKRDFEGFDFDMQAGQTTLGDDQEYRLSGVFGANLSENRGNVMLGFERSSRSEIRKVDRDFYREGFTDPASNIGATFWSASGFSVNAANLPSQAAVNAIFGTSPSTGGNVGRTGNFYMNPDGTLYKESNDGAFRYNAGTIEPTTGLPWRYRDAITGNLKESQIRQLAQIPLERYSLFGRAHLDLSDSITAFAQVLYSENSTRATGSDPPMLGGWRTNIPHGSGIYAPSVAANGNTLIDYLPGGKYGLNCAPTGGCTNSQVWPTPPELTALLNSRPNPNADFDVRQGLVWAGSRRSYIDTESHQIVAGLDGKLPIKDWTWEAYVSTGSTTTINSYAGATSLARWRFVQQQPNYGRGLFYTGNPLGAGFGAGTITCTSGFASVYGVSGYTEGQTPSDDCQKAVLANPKATGKMKQNVTEFDLQGAVAKMPAGEMRFAAGLASRVNKYEYLPDALNTPQSVLDQPGSFFPVGEAVGKTEVKELYGELLVPLLSGKKGAKSMNLELGYRKTDNNPSEDDDSYKVLLDWTIVDRVRFRGGRQIANRAPNIGELFQASEQFAPFTFVQGDPCSTRDPALLPYTANPTINGARALKVQNLCKELMGGPTSQGATTFYGDPLLQPNTLQSPRISNLMGNPNLRSEKAETLTAGIVASLAKRSTLSVDWWQIRIKSMIAEEFGDVLYQECLDETTNPTYDPNHPSCRRLVRNPADGTTATISTSFTNQQQVDLAGVDVQYDWRKEVGPGSMSVNMLATFTQHTKTRTSNTAAWFDYAGSSGPSNIRSVNPYSYDYRLFTTVSYSLGDWNASLRWRHLPSIKSEAAVRTLASTDIPTDAYDIFDASAHRSLGSKVDLRFGVDNLFNVDPQITFAQAGGYSFAGDTNENFYDFLGTRYYIGVKMKF
jgi:outer membrane receptor protein involved in Fe transport